MGAKRRTVLRVLGLGAVFGTTGAAGRELLSEQDPEPAPAQQASQSQPAQQTESESTPPALATRTTEILDELSWFATEYDDAIRAYRDAAKSVRTTVSEHGETIQLSESDVDRLDGRSDQPRIDEGWPYDIWWDEGERRWRYVDIDWQRPRDEVTDDQPLPDSAITELRSVTNAFIDTLATELDPHFSGIAEERAYAADTINSINRFNDRGDTAMVVAGLVRLSQRYSAIDSAAYVETALSANPIRNRLAGFLQSSISRGSPPLFEVEYRQGRAKPHSAFVYADTVGQARRDELYDGEPLETIDGSTGGVGGLRLQNVVGALKYETNRVDRCFVLVSEWNRPSNGYYSATLPSESVFVQRYTTGAAAGDAQAALFEREDIATVPASFPLGGGDRWTTIRFPFRGEPWHAALRQVGRHIIVAGVARRPFEHRSSGWAAPLELSWVRVASSDE